MTRLPQPAVWRFCRTLGTSGYVVAAGDGKLALGIPMLGLGYLVLIRQGIAKVALPYMASLTERFKLGTSLSTRNGLDMVYLQRTHGDFIYMNDPVGARRPLRTAPSSWACLAAYDDVQRERILKAQKQRDPKAWRATERNILKAFKDYEKYGYILSIGVLNPHFNAIAVPVRVLNGG